MAINEDRKCNDLTGKEWLQNSFSIWRNINKEKAEKELEHPASFPVALAEKIIRTFAKKGSRIIDPFNGIGSTTLAASKCDCSAVGIDLSKKFCNIASKRVNDENINIICGDCLEVLQSLNDNMFDLCVTSPPYWDILNMKHSVDKKATTSYSKKKTDLGNILKYNDFINALGNVFELVAKKIVPNGYCVINVMDIRKKSNFYPLHCDLVTELSTRGFYLDDIIIWDRQQEYNNMRPLGYPYKFRINKVHEYLMIFIKKGVE